MSDSDAGPDTISLSSGEVEELKRLCAKARTSPKYRTIVPFEDQPEVEVDEILIRTDKASIKLCPNGDIFVNERLAENDKAVVEGMRALLGLGKYKRWVSKTL